MRLQLSFRTRPPRLISWVQVINRLHLTSKLQQASRLSLTWSTRLLQVLPHRNWWKWGSFKTSRTANNKSNLLLLLLTSIQPHLDFLQVPCSFQVVILCPLHQAWTTLRFPTRTQKFLMHSCSPFWALWTRRIRLAATTTSLILLHPTRTLIVLMGHRTPSKIISVL